MLIMKRSFLWLHFIFCCLTIFVVGPTITSSSTSSSNNLQQPWWQQRTPRRVRFCFTHQLKVHRKLPNTSPVEAYERCLRGWREENLGLPVLPPIVLDKGDEETGVGLVILRIPPFGLKEGIVDCQNVSLVSDVDKHSKRQIEMHYRVLNPSWITWPVQQHAGRIKFLDSADGTDGCDLIWQVQWTPLVAWPAVSPIWNAALEKITALIIEIAADYVASGDKSWSK